MSASYIARCMIARLRAATGGGVFSTRIACSATAFHLSTMSGRGSAWPIVALVVASNKNVVAFMFSSNFRVALYVQARRPHHGMGYLHVNSADGDCQTPSVRNDWSGRA